MAGQKAMLEALGTLEVARNRMFALYGAKPPGWKQEYVRCRRDHQAQLTRINRIADDWVATRAETPEGRELRALIARMRSVLADHQARWSVANIDAEDPEYRASMARVDVARNAILAFAHASMTG